MSAFALSVASIGSILSRYDKSFVLFMISSNELCDIREKNFLYVSSGQEYLAISRFRTH